MATTFIVDQRDYRRSRTIEFMRDTYRQSYGADLVTFPKGLFIRCDASGRPVCAAGLRTDAEGFFSERYLDRPVERTIAERVGHGVERSTICEVTTLVSRAPHETRAFIDDIVELIAERGFLWSFYTLTQRLAHMLGHMGLSPLDLAPADASRVPSPESWGRYYLTAPRVFAVSAEHLFGRQIPNGAHADHAVVPDHAAVH